MGSPTANSGPDENPKPRNPSVRSRKLRSNSEILDVVDDETLDRRGSKKGRKGGKERKKAEDGKKGKSRKEEDDGEDGEDEEDEEAVASEHAAQYGRLKKVRSKSRGTHSRVQPSAGGPARANQKSTRGQSSHSRIPGRFSSILAPPYALLKRCLLLYVLWMIVSHASVAFMDQTDPPRNLSDCTIALFTEGIQAQGELNIIMGDAGRNHELARAMTGHESALRHLKVQVAASNLSCKTELVHELESLLHLSDNASWAISDFAAKISSTIHSIIDVNKDMVKKLEAARYRHDRQPPEQWALLGMLHPFSAFKPTRDALAGEEVKKAILGANSRIIALLLPCNADSTELHQLFTQIQSTHDRIHALAVHCTGNDLLYIALSSLWKASSRNSKNAEYQSHQEQLSNLDLIYSLLWGRGVDINLAMVSSRLKKYHREISSAELVMSEVPFEAFSNAVRNSTEWLESGRKALEQIQVAGRPGLPEGSDTGTVGAIVTSRGVSM